MRKRPPKKPRKRLIFRPWITVKGKRVYPRKGGVFPIWVDDDEE